VKPTRIATVGIASVGAVAFGASYTSWQFYSEPSAALASDDFFNECRGFGGVGDLEPGRYERILSHYIDDADLCKSVIGVCNVVLGADGQLLGMIDEASTRHETASETRDCTFIGWLTQPSPPLRKVN
jgi:hypothetical protein